MKYDDVVSWGKGFLLFAEGFSIIFVQEFHPVKDVGGKVRFNVE